MKNCNWFLEANIYPYPTLSVDSMIIWFYCYMIEYSSVYFPSHINVYLDLKKGYKICMPVRYPSFGNITWNVQLMQSLHQKGYQRTSFNFIIKKLYYITKTH